MHMGQGSKLPLPRNYDIPLTLSLWYNEGGAVVGVECP